MYVIVSYIPPNSTIELYEKHLANIDFVDSLNNNLHKIFIIGDFNLSDINWSYSLSENMLIPCNIKRDSELTFIDHLFALNLYQINNIVNNLDKILDLVFTSQDELKVSITDIVPHNLLNNSIHHKELFIEIQVYSYLKLNCNNSKSFNFLKSNFIELDNYLGTVDWKTEFLNLNLKNMLNRFTGILNTAFNLFVPYRTKKNVSKPPWYNKRLTHLKNLKNKSYAKYKMSNTLDDKNKFCKFRKEFMILGKFLHRNYILNMELNLKNDPKQFWSFINSKRKSIGIPTSMNFKGDNSTDINKTLELFAKFFESVYTTSQGTPVFISDIAPKVDIGSIHLDYSDVLNGLQDLKPNHIPGVDGIPALVLKKCSKSVCFPLLIIFNLSLSSGLFLDEWKSSFLIPIYKSGLKNNVENYRGICKLSAIPKLLESLVKCKLNFFVKEHLSDAQHGFISGRSTVTNLACFSSFVTNCIESQSQVDAIYTDFSKAFDSVCHNILLSKLENFGIHSNLLQWISSFLTDRFQKVKLDNRTSRSIKCTSGVPQGSHLGPLLFIIFIDDICNNIKFSQCLIYADDLKLFLKVNSIYDCFNLQKDLDHLCYWCMVNRLKLNVKKCFAISVSRKLSTYEFTYSLDCTPLQRTALVKDLGVSFNSKFSFAPHIDTIVAKANTMIGFIKRNSTDFSDPYTLVSLYNSLVRSSLEYADVIWNPFQQTFSDRIEKVQNRFTRFVFFKMRWNFCPDSQARYNLLGLRSLKSRRTIHDIMFVRDILCNHIKCPNLLSLICIYAPIRPLRERYLLFQPKHRTNYGMNEPVSRSIREFNEVISHTDIAWPRNKFKTDLYYLFLRN